MEIKGLWKGSNSDELIKLVLKEGTDDYILYYGDELQLNEEVQIFLSNEQSALLTGSKKFGRQIIFFKSKDCMIIGKELFVRQ